MGGKLALMAAIVVLFFVCLFCLCVQLRTKNIQRADVRSCLDAGCSILLRQIMARSQLPCDCPRRAGHRPGAHIKVLGSSRERGKVGSRLKGGLGFHLGFPVNEAAPMCSQGEASQSGNEKRKKKKKRARDKENAMLCTSCAKWSLQRQEVTKGEAAKEVKEDEEEEEIALL